MGGIPEIVLQGGVAVVVVFVVLTKFIELIKYLTKGNHNPIVTPAVQSELCKEHHAQLLEAIKSHKTDADQYMRDAFGILRKNSDRLALIVGIESDQKAIKQLLEAWRIDYEQITEIVKHNTKVIDKIYLKVKEE